jgi:hypothetical protein
MKAEMSDTRPEIEPSFFSWRDLPADQDNGHRLFTEMADGQRAHGAVFWRFTIVSPEYPNPPYPDGLYVEGWKDVPEGPWKQAPFSFPLTETKP